MPVARRNHLLEAVFPRRRQIERATRRAEQGRLKRIRYIVFVCALQARLRIGQARVAGLAQELLQQRLTMRAEDEVRA